MQNDTVVLKSFLEDKTHNVKKSKITNFLNIDSIYTYSNELLKKYPKYNLEDKKILTITSSGDHALEAILNGAKEIDSIDINIFCKYQAALKNAMIKKYDFFDFFEKYNSIINAKKFDYYKLSKILDEVSIYLSSNELDFWNIYINETNDENYVITDLFYSDSRTLAENNSYYDKYNYNILKDKLTGAKITYYDEDIMDFKNDKKYDFVYLSNIIQRMNMNKCSSNSLIKNIIENISDDATIFSYFFYVDIDEILKDCCDDIYIEEKRIMHQYFKYRPDVLTLIKKRK